MEENLHNKFPLLENSEENRELFQKQDKCDKYDYLAAVGCGAIGGIIDIFLVGAPGQSTLGNWTDSQVDNAVKGFARMRGWKPKEASAQNVSSAIGYLEGKNVQRVNYDQRHSGDVGNKFNMSTKNHHIKSLSHSPDIIGLFFSLLNQFTSTSSFIDGGKIITINTETFELQGGNLIAKVFSGIANWFSHIMSDIAGSSGSKGRGIGVVMPFYELLQFCKFGKFSVGQDKQDLATIAVRAFQEGYDFRFGLAMAIPVVITDLSIRLIWSLRQYFQYGKPIGECFPTQRHPDLRVMLLLGNGTLCVMDGIDAGLRSNGNFLTFFTRLNLIAWLRFVVLVMKEVFIRVGIKDSLQKHIDAYKRINETLLLYLKELEKIDIELFKKETEEYNKAISIFISASSEEELNQMLLVTFHQMGLDKPWKDDLDDHMSNKNATLEFK